MFGRRSRHPAVQVFENLHRPAHWEVDGFVEFVDIQRKKITVTAAFICIMKAVRFFNLHGMQTPQICNTARTVGASRVLFLKI